MNILRWLLNTQLKLSHKQNKNNGFTLIELLVAMLIAFLVITPLLGFMIGVLNTDRQEQAKANSEQEIKAALDYIARDLQQALYIYDDTGITAINSQIPAVTNGVPVLVFWKREFTKDTLETKNGATVLFRDDAFVYSLVAYYLIKDTSSSSNWSQAARIARWQIKDGVLNSSGRTDCPGFTTEKYSLCPDKGFKQFDLSDKGKTLQEKMNSWTNSLGAGGTYNQSSVVLVDFIDQTTISQENPTVTAASVTCPTPTGLVFKRVPASIERRGFYACVNSVGTDNRSTVEVYLRGNAQARLIQNDETKIRYTQSKASYFPNANIKVQGRSFIFNK
ncbi:MULTISPECIES: hormogonium polysaccharide secretion pseudopilin HpsC [Nostoc]|uniref:Prepilin-type N-terminal cleavage/methylation domain-containing protein n=1 Tax=Nostoc paludosum FACHB-159 TaxID=2692908 RepID=A0ABR8KDI1_9NOSO|nr:MULTISPECIES: hormogonium polysaccharide secretion pseudopilin HpsC [Nostoc]MBD2679908.1 prepilin-type N-terminal cleavage/methylation domain-containing protein [Nostoc sp. FACHB-857]MBD2736162.1 prepilin-type N-terminal cleavage/methylation domain-containing protein [Nostoc paludosum FACHB-159]